MPHLRKISRLKYFEKREPQKFRELEDRIRDEKELFDGENLTKLVWEGRREGKGKGKGREKGREGKRREKGETS